MTTGAVSGAVTTNVGAAPLAGVSVTAAVGSSMVGTATTDASGNYSLGLPAGTYTVTFSRSNYTSGSATANVAIGVTTPLNATLAEAASGKPTVTLAANGQNVGYNTSFNLTATATSPLGYTLSYSWTGATGTGNTATGTTPSLTTALAGVAAPTNDPGSYVSPYAQETRFGILPITPDTRGATSVTVTANDGRGGSTSTSVTVNAAGVQTGVKSVALGLPVYMNSGIANDTTTTWSVTPPAGSAVSTTMGGQTGRNAFFTPDVVGPYAVTATSGATTNTMTVYAGTYAGVITGGSYTTETFSKTDPKAGMWFDPTNATYWPSGVIQATYTNWPVVTPDPACLGCHSANNPPFNGSTAPDEFTPWTQTAHATFFSRGLENITSNSGSCLTCHTVGYDLASSATNSGFDDMASAEGFVYQKSIGAWAAMATNYPQTTRRANIQCENCHGPQTTSASPFVTAGAHGTTLSGTNSNETSTAALRVSFSSEVCATCHASGTGHHNYSEWLNLDPDTGYGHSNMASTSANFQDGTSAHCGRCHSAQGYSLYLTQLDDGYIGNLFTDPATVYASVGGLGTTPNWDATSEQPQTCTACHDPHDDSNPNQLRLYDSTPLLPAGFSVVGLGKGAVCVSCHNSRNGAQTGSNTLTYLHEDGETYHSGNPTSYSAPHLACQGDVLMGRNAYFMGPGTLPMISKHANAEDACVGCHMDLNPQTHNSHGSQVVSTHVWYIRDQDRATVCANCHSSNVTGDALVANVESLLQALGTKLANKMSSDIATAQSTTTVYYTDGNTNATGSLGTVTAISIEEVHGQVAFQVTDAGGVHDVQLGKFTTGSPAGTAIVPLTDTLVKGGWNYFLIEGDSSKGVHNPSFVTGVLNATISQF